MLNNFFLFCFKLTVPDSDSMKIFCFHHLFYIYELEFYCKEELSLFPHYVWVQLLCKHDLQTEYIILVNFCWTDRGEIISWCWFLYMWGWKVKEPFIVNRLAHFKIKLFFLLSFNSSLYSFVNSLLWDMPFANIFSRSVSFLVLLTVSFTEQMHLTVIKSTLPIISFMEHVSGVVTKKSLLYPRSSMFSPVVF